MEFTEGNRVWGLGGVTGDVGVGGLSVVTKGEGNEKGFNLGDTGAAG